MGGLLQATGCNKSKVPFIYKNKLSERRRDMKKTSIFLVGIVALNGVVLLTKAGEAQQNRTGMSQQAQVSSSARQQKISQLRKEAEQAEREYQRQNAQVKRLERFEKSATFMKKGADAAIEAGPKIAPDPATKAQAVGIGLIYKGVTKSILDPQGAERRNKLMEDSRARMEEENRRKQQWAQDILRTQEEFNRRLRVPNFTER